MPAGSLKLPWRASAASAEPGAPVPAIVATAPLAFGVSMLSVNACLLDAGDGSPDSRVQPAATAPTTPTNAMHATICLGRMRRRITNRIGGQRIRWRWRCLDEVTIRRQRGSVGHAALSSLFACLGVRCTTRRRDVTRRALAQHAPDIDVAYALRPQSSRWCRAVDGAAGKRIASPRSRILARPGGNGRRAN
jgi:hypothetical protein